MLQAVACFGDLIMSLSYLCTAKLPDMLVSASLCLSTSVFDAQSNLCHGPGAKQHALGSLQDSSCGQRHVLVTCKLSGARSPCQGTHAGEGSRQARAPCRRRQRTWLSGSRIRPEEGNRQSLAGWVSHASCGAPLLSLKLPVPPVEACLSWMYQWQCVSCRRGKQGSCRAGEYVVHSTDLQRTSAAAWHVVSWPIQNLCFCSSRA